MLRQILLIAKEAGLQELHLSVERDNEASIKTIVKNGGKYCFEGWYTKKDGGKRITSKSKGCAKIKKLYECWTKIS